jgi:hypothetical protein
MGANRLWGKESCAVYLRSVGLWDSVWNCLFCGKGCQFQLDCMDYSLGGKGDYILNNPKNPMVYQYKGFHLDW